MKGVLTLIGGWILGAFSWYWISQEQSSQSHTSEHQDIKLEKPLATCDEKPSIEKIIIKEIVNECSGASESLETDILEHDQSATVLEPITNSQQATSFNEPRTFLQRFDDEEVDEDWALAMEEKVKYVIASALNEGGGIIKRLECRSSGCLLDLSGQEGMSLPQMTAKVMQSFGNSEEWSNENLVNLLDINMAMSYSRLCIPRAKDGCEKQ